MANIHTLKEYGRSSRPTSAAFPNAWAQGGNRMSASVQPRTQLDDDVEVQYQSQFQFTYIGIDGKQRMIERPEGCCHVCGTLCCPCFVPPFCTPDKKEQYMGLVKSFSFLISVVQVIMLIVAISIGGFVSPSVNPSLGPSGEVFIELGAKFSYVMQKGQVWRFITPVLLHGGIIHLFFNVFAQLRFGLVLEKKWGIPKFLALYCISGIGATLMSCLLIPNRIGVGASGAILGLMGAYLSEILLTWNKSDPRIRKLTLVQVVVVIFITMMFSFSPYVDGAAHFGGLLVGSIIGAFYFNKETTNPVTQKLTFLLPPILLFVYFIVGFFVFFFVIQTSPTPQ